MAQGVGWLGGWGNLIEAGTEHTHTHTHTRWITKLGKSVLRTSVCLHFLNLSICTPPAPPIFKQITCESHEDYCLKRRDATRFGRQVPILRSNIGHPFSLFTAI